MVARHRVAPAAPAHRAAPQPGGRSKSPKRDKKASKKSAKSGRKSPVHRPPPPPPNLDEAAKKRAREEKEKDQLLRMRAEELLIRNEELFQAKRKIGELEKALSDSTEVTMGLRDTVASLKVQVAELQTTVGTLTQNHTAAKRETSLVQAELTAAQTLIGSTPGLMRVPVAATEAIASAVAPRPAAPTPSHDPNHDASHDELSLVDMEADPAPPSDAVPGSTAEAPSWNAIEWLSTTRVLEVVARALLAPMRELEESGRLLTDELTEIGFFRSLAAAPAARAALLSLLSEGHTLLYELTDELLDAVHRLADRRPIELGSICGKFVEGGEVSGYDGAAPGSISSGARINPRALREGIEHILGPPHPRVTETMGQEHCFSADSRVPFEASAYRMRTTSQIEWWFVLDPLEGTGGVLNVARDLGTDAALSEAGYPAEEGPMAAGEPRRPRSLNDVLVSVRNSRANFPKQLAAAGVEPLVDAEIIAARLWTGPMHVKYQAVLRSLCTGGRIEGRKSDARKHHAALCAGNKYVTTIHAINSALCKLSKIGSRTKVYRGVSCAGLPSGLWENAPTGRPGSPPPGSGYGSGGEEVEAAGGAEPAASAHMEAGFLSCTADAELALRFGTSSADEGGANGAERRLVFEMSTHTTERPAELACLSQYPAEQECAFPPLASTEVVGTRVDGSCVVVEMQVSMRGGGRSTLTQNISRLKRSHTELLESVLEDMSFCELPERATAQLRSLLATHRRFDDAAYRHPDKFGTLTREAVEVQRRVLDSLVEPSTWAEATGDPAAVARKMQKAASYCRRVGRGDVASQLNRLSHALVAQAKAKKAQAAASGGRPRKGSGGKLPGGKAASFWSPWRPGGILPAAPDVKKLA